MTRTKRLVAWANLFGLTAAFVGGLLLIFALTLKSSSYQLVEKTNHEVAICHDGKIVASGYGGPLGVTDELCPAGSSAPIIEADRPAYANWGLFLICLGFLFQLPSAIAALSAAT